MLSPGYRLRSNVGHRDDFPKIVLKETRELPIRVIDFGKQAEKTAHSILLTLVDQILAAKRVDAGADTSAPEAEIDRHVYSLYGLTPEEIDIVEGKA